MRTSYVGTIVYKLITVNCIVCEFLLSTPSDSTLIDLARLSLASVIAITFVSVCFAACDKGLSLLCRKECVLLCSE